MKKTLLHRSSFIVLPLLALGCSDSRPTTQPTSMRERQDAALRDPFGYSVDVGKETSSSHSGIFGLDKEGLKRDTDHVLNP